MSVLLRQDYVVISKHENGYWMARAFWKRETAPLNPDDECSNHQKTFKPEDPLETAVQWTKNWYQFANVTVLPQQIENKT
jgi:hypothetical protein